MTSLRDIAAAPVEAAQDVGPTASGESDREPKAAVRMTTPVYWSIWFPWTCGGVKRPSNNGRGCHKGEVEWKWGQGYQTGEQMETWKVAFPNLDLWIIANTRIVSATSNWTQTKRSRAQVYEFPPPRLRPTFRFRWTTMSVGSFVSSTILFLEFHGAKKRVRHWNEREDQSTSKIFDAAPTLPGFPSPFLPTFINSWMWGNPNWVLEI